MKNAFLIKLLSPLLLFGHSAAGQILALEEKQEIERQSVMFSNAGIDLSRYDFQSREANLLLKNALQEEYQRKRLRNTGIGLACVGSAFVIASFSATRQNPDDLLSRAISTRVNGLMVGVGTILIGGSGFAFQGAKNRRLRRNQALEEARRILHP